MARSRENVVPLYISAAAGLVLCFASVALFFSETRIFARPDETAPEFADFLTSDANQSSLSSYSKVIVLADCWYGLNPPANAPNILARRLAIAKRCRSIAGEIAEAMPSNGLAWVVRAQSALVRGDIDGFLSDLKLSQRVTPNEAAKARLRVILAEANMALLDEPARQAHISDIRMLAGTTEGMRWIAQRYLANPEYRETIVQVIESLPDERQRRFLGELKNSPST